MEVTASAGLRIGASPVTPKLPDFASKSGITFGYPSPRRLDAGTSSGWISRLADAAGLEVIVANPRELRKIHQSDRKNDRSDAQVLARMARFDPQLLAPITHRSAVMQNDLAVIRARDVLVRARTQCVNAARGLVKTAGGRLSTCSAESFARKVSAQLPSELESALLPMLRTI